MIHSRTEASTIAGEVRSTEILRPWQEIFSCNNDKLETLQTESTPGHFTVRNWTTATETCCKRFESNQTKLICRPKRRKVFKICHMHSLKPLNFKNSHERGPADPQPHAYLSKYFEPFSRPTRRNLATSWIHPQTNKPLASVNSISKDDFIFEKLAPLAVKWYISIYGMSSVWLTEILETFPQAFWFEKSRIKENGGKRHTRYN